MHKQSLVSTFKMRVSCFSLFHIRAKWISFGSGLLVWQKEQVVIVRYFSMIQNKGWKANVQLLEVGCRGFVAISTSRILQEMVVVGRPARQRSDLSRAAENGSQWLCMKRKASTWALMWIDGIQGVRPKHWESLLNHLEVSWAYQRNIKERGRLVDNLKDATPPFDHPAV